MKLTPFRLTILSSLLLGLSACSTMMPPAGNDNAGYTPDPGITTPYTPPVAVTPDPAVPQQQYVVQLTASSSPAKAEGIRNMFNGTAYNAFVSPLMVNGRLLHRVQIGYFNNEQDAQMTLAQLQRDYPYDVYVNDAIVKTP